ncbi:MAG: 50S ribosomal protein L4 [Clostridiales bacterium]|jgi:large subunit ribosomal protein L4|nr:50S ribosomal protein L4 [Clostridiales bacterium]
MPTIEVVNMQGKSAGTITLSDEVFGIKPNTAAMHLVVRSILANKRQGTQSALTRGMVRGGGRKIYRQKGTGRARHHGNRAPQFRHGGVAFAPQPRDYVVKVPKKVRRLAMKSALSSKLSAGDIIVVDQIALTEGKTKHVVQMLKDLGVNQRALLVLPSPDELVTRASRNIQKLSGACVNTLNVYDILRAGKIIVSKSAIPGIEEVYA